jgi:hypothetical protein
VEQVPNGVRKSRQQGAGERVMWESFYIEGAGVTASCPPNEEDEQNGPIGS